MKAFAFLVLFLSSSILLFGQNRADTTVYIEPIHGGSAADQTFFEENIKMEVSAAGYNVIDDHLDAIYSMRGSIEPEDDGNVLSISLSNVAENREMVTQELFYSQVEESYEVLPFLVWQMMANAPFLITDAPSPPASSVVAGNGASSQNRITPIVNLINAIPEDDSWKHKWLYMGVKFGPSLHFFMSSADAPNDTDPNDNPYFTIAPGLELAVQVLDFLSIQAEVNFSLERGDYRGLTDGSGSTNAERVYKASYLYTPLLLKGVVKPGNTFFLEPFGGAYLNLALGLSGDNMTLPIGGWLAGADFGFKVGAGILFIDFRYAMDFFDTTVSDALVAFKRHSITVSGGYKVGFFNRKQSVTRFRGARYLKEGV